MASVQNPVVRRISTAAVKPPPSASGAHPPRCELTPWDLGLLSVHYIQAGHLFSLPTIASDIDRILDNLRTSLSAALLHYYPVAGRLATTGSEGGSGSCTYIDCNDEGAELVHARADNVHVSDVLVPSADVLSFLREFFQLDEAVNYDGHTLPLLSIQATQLEDGLFLGFSFNHAIGDGTSFWQLLNSWAEICRGSRDSISLPPVHDRWFHDGRTTPIHLPFSSPDEFVERFAPPVLRERMFHFSAKSIRALKARASSSSTGNIHISSFQALSALLWRTITRSRRLPEGHETSCRLAIQNRARLQPPLSPAYFGNSINILRTTTTAGELLAHDLGWAAALLYRSIANHTDGAIRGELERWALKPEVYRLSREFGGSTILLAKSPRFDMYGCDFGWGKAVALRSGSGIKFDGNLLAYPGKEGNGSIDMEVCLAPETMCNLELDEEFMTAAC